MTPKISVTTTKQPAAASGPRADARSSRDDVGREHVLDAPDHVLERELPFLQTLGLDLIHRLGQGGDGGVELAMLRLEGGKLVAKLCAIVHRASFPRTEAEPFQHPSS